ncbi:MAG: hypothetical protein R3200_10375, partial [Xanthomonadales bacterium]|nr:hypothetical protein [Xanthomonadales bacterium]
RSCDATRVFERQCRGQGSCEVQVDNSLCGDPAGGRQKFALIQYACNGQPQQKLVEEGNVARLECSGGSPRLPTAPPAAPPVAPPASSPTIRIEDARYGAGNRTCEANLAFARACNGQWSCEVPVDNELCGDPARGDRKSVEVEYRCGDRSLTAVVDEGDTARLACDAEPARPGRPDRYGRNLRIESVTYGARNGTCDASLAFARACNGERACEITIDNSLCGDPARNTRKSVDIEYRCGDRPLRFSADEGATVRLDCSGGRIVSGGSTRSRTVDIRMDDVVYGFGGRTCNATLAFARQCNGEPTCAVQIDNELCGDPAPNTRKRADIEYRCGDRRRTLSVDEGATAELDCL